MSESENPEKSDGPECEIPAVPDICRERRNERLLKGSGFLLLAFVLILKVEAAWIYHVGFLFAGSGVALLGAGWAAYAALVALAVLNSFVGAGWGGIILMLGVGGAAALLSSLWLPACRKCFSLALDLGLKKMLVDEEERRFTQILARQFAPVVGFVLCVYAAFGLLGFLEEFMTITIAAAFVWCAKMERYYGGVGEGGMILSETVDRNLEDALIRLSSFLSMRAFPPGEGGEIPKIEIGIAKRAVGPIYLVLSAYGCPGKFAKKNHQIYRFMQISALVQDAERIMKEEMKSRSTSNPWYGHWDHWGLFGHLGNEQRWRVGGVKIFMPGLSPNAFMLLMHFYFWFFIRHRYKSLGSMVRVIGESMGKILYMFYKSDSVARDTFRLL